MSCNLLFLGATLLFAVVTAAGPEFTKETEQLCAESAACSIDPSDPQDVMIEFCAMRNTECEERSNILNGLVDPVEFAPINANKPVFVNSCDELCIGDLAVEPARRAACAQCRGETYDSKAACKDICKRSKELGAADMVKLCEVCSAKKNPSMKRGRKVSKKSLTKGGIPPGRFFNKADKDGSGALDAQEFDDLLNDEFLSSAISAALLQLEPNTKLAGDDGTISKARFLQVFSKTTAFFPRRRSPKNPVKRARPPQSQGQGGGGSALEREAGTSSSMAKRRLNKFAKNMATTNHQALLAVSEAGSASTASQVLVVDGANGCATNINAYPDDVPFVDQVFTELTTAWVWTCCTEWYCYLFPWCWVESVVVSVTNIVTAATQLLDAIARASAELPSLISTVTSFSKSGDAALVEMAASNGIDVEREDAFTFSIGFGVYGAVFGGGGLEGGFWFQTKPDSKQGMYGNYAYGAAFNIGASVYANMGFSWQDAKDTFDGSGWSFGIGGEIIIGLSCGISFPDAEEVGDVFKAKPTGFVLQASVGPAIGLDFGLTKATGGFITFGKQDTTSLAQVSQSTSAKATSSVDANRRQVTSATAPIVVTSSGWDVPQIPGQSYLKDGVCWLARTSCFGCLGNPPAYPQDLQPCPPPPNAPLQASASSSFINRIVNYANKRCNLNNDWLQLAETISYVDAQNACAATGRSLCPRSAYCPNGNVVGGGWPYDAWAPVSDEFNSWVQVGVYYWPTCALHKEIAGGIHGNPAWGLDNSWGPYKGHVMCC